MIHPDALDTGPGRYAWRRFWDRGRWWTAVVVVVGYVVGYELASLLLGVLLGDRIGPGGLFASAGNVVILLVLPLLVGALVLAGFVTSLGWWRQLFVRQPVPGAWWMWILVLLAAIPIGLRLAGIDYAGYRVGVVAATLFGGVLIGFTEEILYRGIVIRLLRGAGWGERLVAVVSSALFALSHTVNLATGQAPLTVGLTVLFTFGFGILMYVVLRATGHLVWPMVVHGLTDPTTFLATGGVDKTQETTAHPLLALAAPFNILFVIAALVAIFFIKGRADLLAHSADQA